MTLILDCVWGLARGHLKQQVLLIRLALRMLEELVELLLLGQWLPLRLPFGVLHLLRVLGLVSVRDFQLRPLFELLRHLA